MNDLNAAIYNKLSAGTALISALGGTAIYHMQAPNETVFPYVVYSFQGGGNTNLTPTFGVDQLEFVRVYHTSAVAAGSIDKLVRAQMQGSLTITGYNFVGMLREDDYESIEIDPSGKMIYAMGAIYRIIFS
jgi:hypothetical protein